ncbi:MAG: PHP domain-containing protein [Dehalococcoidia bacterium]
MKVDLHLHTCYSPDARSPLDGIIRKSQELGLGCIVVTDHNTIEGALRMKEISPLPVIVGEEVMTTAGEIIGYFLEEEIPRGLTPFETMSRIKEQGGLVCLPHPFDGMGRHPLKAPDRDGLLSYIDIIEVFNARSLKNNFSMQALGFAREHGFLQSAGSDSHTLSEIGNAYVEMPDFGNPEEFKSSLKQGQIFGRKNSMKNRLVTALVTLPKRTRYHLSCIR